MKKAVLLPIRRQYLGKCKVKEQGCVNEIYIYNLVLGQLETS